MHVRGLVSGYDLQRNAWQVRALLPASPRGALEYVAAVAVAVLVACESGGSCGGWVWRHAAGSRARRCSTLAALSQRTHRCATRGKCGGCFKPGLCARGALDSGQRWWCGGGAKGCAAAMLGAVSELAVLCCYGRLRPLPEMVSACTHV